MKRIPTFLAGMLTMALIGSLGVGALAATGRMTINVDPVNIQVNGQTFKPADAKGNEVPVFAYQGTTYAPLRALAEAYGLEVGYDAAANMATVKDAGATPSTPDTTAPSTDYSNWTKEEEAAYQEFKGLWDLEFSGADNAETKFHSSNEPVQKRNIYSAELKPGVSLPKSYTHAELELFGVRLFSDLGIANGEILHLAFPLPIGYVITDGNTAYIV